MRGCSICRWLRRCRTYAGAKDQPKLESLLAPVRRGAERSELVREMLKSKALFAPQAWSVRQAYRFLRESPRIEEAGVVVRVPDWWSARRPPRPQVQVRIGAKGPSAVGLDSLLDFQVGLALDGESLSEEERRQLLASTDGLALLRGKWVEVDRQQLQQALDHWKRLEQEQPDGIGFIEGMRLLAGASSAPPKRLTSRWSRGPESRRAIGCARRSTACVSRIRSMHSSLAAISGRHSGLIRPRECAG